MRIRFGTVIESTLQHSLRSGVFAAARDWFNTWQDEDYIALVVANEVAGDRLCLRRFECHYGRPAQRRPWPALDVGHLDRLLRSGPTSAGGGRAGGDPRGGVEGHRGVGLHQPWFA